MRCAQCRRELAPDEPVWRALVASGYRWPDGGFGTLRSICAQCRTILRSTGTDPPRPCCHCGRPVTLNWNRSIPEFVACSPQCQQAAYSADFRRRHKTRRATITCATCGTDFTPRRADATYCSPACRQKAYRARAGLGLKTTAGNLSKSEEFLTAPDSGHDPAG